MLKTPKASCYNVLGPGDTIGLISHEARRMGTL